MWAKIANLGTPSRLAVEAWLAVLATWLVVQNAVLFGVLGTRVDWLAVRRTASGVAKIAEVLAETLGPWLVGGSVLATLVGALVIVGFGRVRREARHA